MLRRRKDNPGDFQPTESRQFNAQWCGTTQAQQCGKSLRPPLQCSEVTMGEGEAHEVTGIKLGSLSMQGMGPCF